MYHWNVGFDILAPLPAFPRVSYVASETQYSAAYHLEGRNRRKEVAHVLYKYTTSGEGVFRDAQGEHPVPAGSGFLCDITDPDIAYYYPAHGREPWTFVYTCLNGGAAFTFMRELLQRFGPIYALPHGTGIIADIQRFQAIGHGRLELSPAEAARLATELFLQLMQSKVAAATRGDDAVLVRRALEVMDASVEARVTAGEVARRLRVSREHLTRVFTAQMGVSLYQYMLRRKMRVACRLLKEGDLVTKEIAAQLGYPDPAHFSRAFRTVVGMTPHDFRAHGAMPAW